MAKKLLIIGGGSAGLSAMTLAALKEKFGDDSIALTPEEAKQQGLTMRDFDDTPVFQIKQPPILPELTTTVIPKSGQENRRERRKQSRKNKK